MLDSAYLAFTCWKRAFYYY